MTAPTTPMSSVEICSGRVMHRRLRPSAHQFSYGVFFLRMPLSALSAISNRWLSLDRFNLMSVMTRDFGPRDGSSLDAWARKLLATGGIDKADGEIVLQAFPRILGYVFNPISVWYCYDRHGHLRAAICEVNNTFGERHNYLIAHDDQRAISSTDWLHARKVFHVSPFCEVRGHYRFRFEQSGACAFAQIDFYDGADDNDKLVVTTVVGTPALATSAAVARAFLTHPLMTVSVVARIHWQAFLLWRKRVPFFSKPIPPVLDTTR